MDMKSFLIVFLIGLSLFSCAPTKSTLVIPPQSSIQIDYLNIDLYEAKIRNKSRQEVEVEVINKKTDESIRGFGLAGYGKAIVMVEEEANLNLMNSSTNVCRISVSFDQLDRSATNKENEGLVDFVLVNSSLKSIPLIIPGVMNPNLSPKSNSGVNLRIGQEIYFREKGRKYLLFVVNESILKGEKVDVPDLIRKRKIELGL